MAFELPSDQLANVPFCGLGTPTVDYVLPPFTGSDSSLIQTQEYGIPPVQQQNPDFGGKPVRRNETNGVLRFYSNIIYFMNQGGQFTYDAPQSTQLGGYAKGAVLWADSINNFVVSLVDNNTFDFVTTPSYIDSIHWQRIAVSNYPDITDTAGLVTITGPGGLHVQQDIVTGGSLGVLGTITAAQSASFFNNGLGAYVVANRTANTLSSSYAFNINAEAPIPIGGVNSAAIGVVNGGGSVIAFPYAVGSGYNRPYLPNTASGDTSNANAIAMVGELCSTQQFSVTDNLGNGWAITATADSGSFPTKIATIRGYATLNLSGAQFFSLDLISAGIMSSGTIPGGVGVATANPNTDVFHCAAAIPPGGPLQISTQVLTPHSGVVVSFNIKFIAS